ncbi:hypothetical protein OE88DRAFT_1665624 [Heliocybe sulcata]|uniref:Uncharacterized protein n=1 Tax=Heliocybe sulcata TaxID=5364 RepID=A0A5C3MRK4_9AGAM|nr:hypothetical protein OE88DRAFT_1665624 [Heliocybe sulcata]
MYEGDEGPERESERRSDVGGVLYRADAEITSRQSRTEKLPSHTHICHYLPLMAYPRDMKMAPTAPTAP